MNRVKGSELKKGDILRVWWNAEDRGSKPNEDIITKIEPVTNRDFLAASFKYNRVGMTIFPDNYYDVVGNENEA